MEISPGFRVVRGPDWNSGDQDGGEGYVGTLVDRPVNGRVTVQWDNGGRAAYRCGEAGKFDLRVLDTGPAGIYHDLVCSSCGESGLFGTVWQCVKCYKYYCCNPCYLGNKHSLFHHFKRIDEKDQSTTVKPRILSKQVTAMGIFVGAKVIRGHDWKWKNQDGGEGSRGILLAVTGMKKECARCVAEVRWPEQSKKFFYRLGRKGKVDLKFIPYGAASGGSYCPSHLPVLGGPVEPSEEFDLVAGDRIQVNLEQDVWKLMQESCGEWSDSMAMFIGKTGLVVYVNDGRSVLVSYNSCFWNINIAAVTKVYDPVFMSGDVVRILDDNTEVSRLQKGHGEWNEGMVKCLGQLGTVVAVVSLGDLHISIQGKKYIFNQACVRHAPSGEVPPTTTVAEPASSHMRTQLKALEQVMSTELVPLAAAAGDAEMLKKALAKDNADVNALNGGKTALHLAIDEGFPHIIEILLKYSPDLEIRDKNKDTPLLTAIEMNEVKCVELLIAAKANVNVRNANQEFPLYLATVKGLDEILSLLVKAPGIDVDCQDATGNTALHVATITHRTMSARILLEGGANPAFYNNKCVNPILLAAIRGFYSGIELCMGKHPEHVDTRKVDDGHNALMIAAVNNCQDIVYLLASLESCDLDAVNEIANQTALHLAATRGHSRIIELLVGFGANLNKMDAEGFFPLHRAFLAKDITPFDEYTPQLKKMEHKIREVKQIQNIPPYLTLCCFMACNGARTEVLYALQSLPRIDLVNDIKLMDMIAESEETKARQDPTYKRYWGSLLRHPADGGAPRARQDVCTSGEILESLKDFNEFMSRVTRGNNREEEAELSENLQRLLASQALGEGNGEMSENLRMLLASQGAGEGGEPVDLTALLSDKALLEEEDEVPVPDNSVVTPSTVSSTATTEPEAALATAGTPSTMAATPPEVPVTPSTVTVPSTVTETPTTMSASPVTAAVTSSTVAAMTPSVDPAAATASIPVATTSSTAADVPAVVTSSTTTTRVAADTKMGTEEALRILESNSPVPERKPPEPVDDDDSSSDYASSSDDDMPYRLPVDQEPDPNLCCLCDNPINVEFHPCGCKSMCSECEQERVKKCPTCLKPVERRTKF